MKKQSEAMRFRKVKYADYSEDGQLLAALFGGVAAFIIFLFGTYTILTGTTEKFGLDFARALVGGFTITALTILALTYLLRQKTEYWEEIK